MIRLILISFSILSFAQASRAQLAYPNTSFEYLYNNFRFSQADPLPWPGSYWPFEGHGLGSGINHRLTEASKSPAQKYDEFFNQGSLAATWEESNHTCTGISSDQAADCAVWYGHCNGWTGAALFNPEPDQDHPITVTNPTTRVTMTFEPMDLKALLSEAWLDAWVSYEGTGMSIPAGDWIFNPQDSISRQPSDNNSDLNNYEAYWDVTPRALFYALTNYVGIRKAGIALDRFTGSEIWNQPLLGYRFLPITKTEPAIEKNGQKVYPVTLGVKLYWANDDIPYDFKRTDSLSWNVADERFSKDTIPSPVGSEWAQERTQDMAVLSRYISFTLFLDSPVTVSADGKQITTSGKILGDGVWAHADPAQRSTWFSLGTQSSQNHPDFLWRPDYVEAKSNYRNPHIDPKKIYKYILRKPMPSEKSPRR